jgi:hypothetical protein
MASSNEHVDEMTNDEGMTKPEGSSGQNKATQDSGLR